MNIIYASNDSYARHLAVSMCSLFDRNQQCPSINVYVLSAGISENSGDRLRRIGDQYGRKHFPHKQPAHNADVVAAGVHGVVKPIL